MKRIKAYWQNKYPRFYNSRLPHFAAVGFIGFLVISGLTALFTEVLGWFYLLSYVASLLVAWTVVFFLHSNFTFSGHRSSTKNIGLKYAQFIWWYAISHIFAVVAVFLLTSLVGRHYLISIVITSLVISMASFFVNKRTIFRYQNHEE